MLILSKFIFFRAFTWVSLLFNKKKHQLFDQSLFFSTKFSTSKLQMKNYFVPTWLNQHLKETGNNTVFLLSPGGKKIAAHDRRVGCNTIKQGQLKILYLDSTRFLDSKMAWMPKKWSLQFIILSPRMILEVFAKANLAELSSCFLGSEFLCNN